MIAHFVLTCALLHILTCDLLVVTPRMREDGVRRGVDKIPSQAKAAIGLALQTTHDDAWSSHQAWEPESACLMGKAQPSNRTD